MQVMLSLISTITQNDGNQETIKQLIPAKIDQATDKIVIRYKEDADTERSFVKIVATSEQMKIERKGAVGYKQNFCPKKESDYMMRLPIGEIAMQLYTNDYQLDKLKKEIYCSYQLFQAGSVLGRYQLFLSWK